ncbi:short-subunit dehydrogenase [Azomonas agilis]|uniref:Short-subunit dehydrogenase n=1 Tax=Azomonas agilis TaxID=116849 RepID=A0A562IYU8_9GAMM|nr:SDR family oxidoreductase [Azomonas agilis]TWH76221.1 short-subunit dehydrogenase [Azomonas agilis]
MELKHCHILLTGASGGIGQALVEHLCAAGAKMLLVSRNTAALEPLKQRYPEQIDSIQADLSLSEGRQAVVAAVAQKGSINCLVNAAGVNEFSLLEHQTEEQIAHLIQVNLTSTLQLTQRLLPLLRQQPQALILNLGSTFGSIGYPGFATYCASKFALRGFSEALRRELADTPIKVLYIAPRATRTGMNTQSVVALNDELNVAMDDPKTVAAQIAAALQYEHELLYLGWPEKFFVRLNSLLPGIVDRALRKQLPVVQRFARQRP